MRKWLLGFVTLVLLGVVSTSGVLAASPVTLNLWENYGTEANATATKNLVAAFHQLHPDITINVVSQPAENYYTLLQAAAISKTGPDIAVMWTGLFTLKYKSFLEKLNSYIPLSDLKKFNGIKWAAENFNPADGVYVVPLNNQFYMGFYNKALFKKAGVTEVPRTWSELFAACQKFKAAGITPMIYGSGSQNLSATFYPYYDFSYLMAAIYSPSEWKGLYDGSIPWTSQKIVDQINNWVKLHQEGCTNQDVLTTSNTVGQFIQGKAAMIIKGDWDVATFQQAMGDNVGVFVPPFSDQPMKSVIEYAGDGFAMTSYSKHKQEAAEFLKFMLTPQAQKIIDEAGLIPDLEGFKTTNTLNQAMLSFSHQKGYTAYPMIDNVIQPEVVNAGSKVLDAALAGQMSVMDALKNLEQTLNSLPPSRRSSTYQ
jgi:raffinose/stachyose/melibiose transport system substrate-binding protein